VPARGIGARRRINDGVIAWCAYRRRADARLEQPTIADNGRQWLAGQARFLRSFQMRSRIDDSIARRRSLQAIVNRQFRLETFEFKAY
jgi:hypothetical protein